MPMINLPVPLTTGQANQLTEIERHFHNWERWFGLAGTPSGETHVADRIGTTVNPFQMDAGNNTWGAWLQILGSSDTPVAAGNVKFDLHRLEVVGIERTNSTHLIQVAFGASGAAALTANTFTEFVFRPTTTQGRSVPIPIMARRSDVGTKAWIRVWVPGQDTGTVDFFHGLHEYEV